MSDSSQGDRRSFGTDIGEVRHEPATPPRGLPLYVAALLLTPFVLVAGTLRWMSTGAYREHAQYAYLADSGYGTRLRGADCEVLVYGDSTALVGVVPRTLERVTGLKACNIAEVAGVQRVNGLMVLDDYLRHNRPPRFLVFLYAPENLTDPPQWTSVSTAEGLFFRLQFRPDMAFARYAARHPDQVITDAELGLRTGAQWLLHRPLPPAERYAREHSGGRVREPGDPLTACPTEALKRPPDVAWLAKLRSTYAASGTKVLIDVTPEPECDPTLAFYRLRLNGLTDNGMETLPVGQYTDTGRLHTNDAGAETLSQRIAGQIVALQAGSKPALPASGSRP